MNNVYSTLIKNSNYIEHSHHTTSTLCNVVLFCFNVLSLYIDKYIWTYICVVAEREGNADGSMGIITNLLTPELRGENVVSHSLTLLGRITEK